MNSYKRIYIGNDGFYWKTFYFSCKNKYITDKTLTISDLLKNKFNRILLISGLDYETYVYLNFIIFTVYMKNIKDFDRYMDVLCTVYNVKLKSITYKRIRIERFFDEYK